MQIGASVNSGRLLNHDVNTTIPECLDAPGRCVYFKQSKFSYRDDEPIAAVDTDTMRTGLLAGLNRSTFAWDGPNKGLYNIYISTRGGALPHNHHQIFNILMEGRKRWILVDPTAYASQSQVNEFELQNETGNHYHLRREADRKWWTGNDYKPQDWFRDVIEKGVDIPHYDFVQEVGDLFFLPHKFTHGTMDLTRHTMGVIFRGKMLNFGTDGLEFPLDLAFAEDTPWLPADSAAKNSTLAERVHKLPVPLQHGQKVEGNEWARVAGGAAKLFQNKQLQPQTSG